MFKTEATWNPKLPNKHLEPALVKMQELLGDEFNEYLSLSLLGTDDRPNVIIRYWPTLEIAEQWRDYLLTLTDPPVTNVQVIIE